MLKLKPYVPGVTLPVGLGVVAMLVAPTLPHVGHVLLALLLGAIVGNSISLPQVFALGLKFTEKQLLELAIVGIGFGFQLQFLTDLGVTTLAFIAGSVGVVVGAALFIGKQLGCKPHLSILMGAGSAICGSAAIAATAPVIKAKDEEIGLSLALINVLGLIGIVLLPAMGLLFGWDESTTGVLIGGVLQSLGHVVASGFSVSESVGNYATIIKMGRILMLIPFLLVVIFTFRRTGKADGVAPGKINFPYFIVFFLVAIGVAQIDAIPESTTVALSDAGDALLCIAMAAIGIKIKVSSLWKISGKGIVNGLLIFAFQIVLFLLIAFLIP